ncbi:MAG: EFR1 family ferrodoxin [Spirochaetales bacterium]|nr:EFR1 family ferrodoxin [Spirochaetales bacterium]
MSAAIYYFSGTGNSLKIARELSKKIKDSTLIPVVAELKKEEIIVSSDIAGFVFPSFCLTLPIPMQQFLKKADVSATKYLFAVGSRGGTTSEAFEYIDLLLKKQRRRLNAGINITMPWNHPIGKKNMTSETNLKRLSDLEKIMGQKLDTFCKAINDNTDYDVPDTDADYNLPQWVKLFFLSKTFNYESHRYMYQNQIKFYSDAKCTGCGICEKVCLSSRIKLKDKKPHWSDDPRCFGCFACINYCPQKAIQVATRFPVISHTPENGRYHHPEANAGDIVTQKADNDVQHDGSPE